MTQWLAKNRSGGASTWFAELSESVRQRRTRRMSHKKYSAPKWQLRREAIAAKPAESATCRCAYPQAGFSENDSAAESTKAASHPTKNRSPRQACWVEDSAAESSLPPDPLRIGPGALPGNGIRF